MPKDRDIPNFPPEAQRSVWPIYARTPALAHAAIVHLQIAHPRIAAGVDQHSHSLRKNPWLRRHKTVGYAHEIIYGSRSEAEESVRAIGHAHAKVKGQVAESAPPHYSKESTYSAFDPDLQRAVIATNIYGILKGHEAFVGPLATQQKDAYTRAYATNFGKHFKRTYTPEHPAPETFAQLETEILQMIADRRLQATDIARNLSRLIINPLPERLSTLISQLQPVLETKPQLAAGLLHLNHEVFQLPYQVARPAAHRLAQVTTGGLLPESLRHQFFPEWTSADDRAFSVLASTVTATTQALGNRSFSKAYRQAMTRWHPQLN